MKLGKYQHYKGNFYEVIGVAYRSETLEKMVVYRALYNSQDFGNQALWVRPQAEFLGSVGLNGNEVPRFKLIEN